MLRRTGILCLVLLLAACKNDLDQLAAIEMDADAPDRVTQQVEYLYSDSGVVRNRLRAGRVSEYIAKGTERTELDQGIELVFLQPDGSKGSVLTARKGSILPKDERMVVEENVVFVNQRGERLETERLVWDQDSNRIWTDEPVRIRRGRDIIHGEGLDANEDFSRYRIRRITGQVFIHAVDTLAPNPPR
jgi:LPS export ABC transporter protein LptC